ncbi:hypothetical protein CYMTET_34514, partial [Cymbomonas tetramitiformis]
GGGKALSLYWTGSTAATCVVFTGMQSIRMVAINSTHVPAGTSALKFSFGGEDICEDNVCTLTLCGFSIGATNLTGEVTFTVDSGLSASHIAGTVTVYHAPPPPSPPPSPPPPLPATLTPPPLYHGRATPATSRHRYCRHRHRATLCLPHHLRGFFHWHSATPFHHLPPSPPLPPPLRPPPGTVSVVTVSSTISFSALDISAFDDSAFEAAFRSDFITQMAAAAQVSSDLVAISSIAQGSVQVGSTVHITDSFPAADASTLEATLRSSSGSIFTYNSFSSYGTINASSITVGVAVAVPPPIFTITASNQIALYSTGNAETTCFSATPTGMARLEVSTLSGPSSRAWAFTSADAAVTLCGFEVGTYVLTGFITFTDSARSASTINGTVHVYLAPPPPLPPSPNTSDVSLAPSEESLLPS